MALKLSTERSFKYPVSVEVRVDNKVVKGSFTGVFRVLKGSDIESDEKRLIDAILIGVEGLELEDGAGNRLEGDALLDAVKDDTELAAAVVKAYGEAMEKKAPAKNKT